jgi:stress response protein YsnF
MEKNDNTTEQDDNTSKEMARPLSDSTEGEQIQLQQQQEQIVPVLEEDYSISKQTNIKEAKIEKRAATKIKSVKVPIVYEELYINGKKLKSVEDSQILSALKDKITSLSGRGNADTSVEQSVSKKNKIENRGELVPLLSTSDEEEAGNSEIQREREKVIPLYEEQFEIIKKTVKVAEIVITKRRVTEKKIIDIDIRGEEVTIKYPDGRSEKIS